jgi:hypothetical protein
MEIYRKRALNLLIRRQYLIIISLKLYQRSKNILILGKKNKHLPVSMLCLKAEIWTTETTTNHQKIRIRISLRKGHM